MIAIYTNKSAHLVIQKNDQKLSNALLFMVKRIKIRLHHTKTSKWSSVAFLRLNKSIQNKKNMTEAIIIVN